MAIDGKYGKVTFEKNTTIGEDEPVVVFRAQDKLLLEVLNAYQRLAINAGSPERHIEAIEDARSEVEHWQTMHEDQVQVPQSASYNRES